MKTRIIVYFLVLALAIVAFYISSKPYGYLIFSNKCLNCGVDHNKKYSGSFQEVMDKRAQVIRNKYLFCNEISLKLSANINSLHINDSIELTTTIENNSANTINFPLGFTCSGNRFENGLGYHAVLFDKMKHPIRFKPKVHNFICGTGSHVIFKEIPANSSITISANAHLIFADFDFQSKFLGQPKPSANLVYYFGNRFPTVTLKIPQVSSHSLQAAFSLDIPILSREMYEV